MIRDEIMEKLGPLMEDETFMAVLKNCEGEDALLSLLAEKGIELTDEEIAEFKACAEEPGELGEDDLENVSGGCVSLITMAFILGVTVAYLRWLQTHNPTLYKNKTKRF